MRIRSKIDAPGEHPRRCREARNHRHIEKFGGKDRTKYEVEIPGSAKKISLFFFNVSRRVTGRFRGTQCAELLYHWPDLTADSLILCLPLGAVRRSKHLAQTTT